MPIDKAAIFKGVFGEIFFPYLAVDLQRLCQALAQPHRTSHIAFGLKGDGEKRAVLAAATSGLVGKIDVPDKTFEFFARSPYVQRLGLSDHLLSMARRAGHFAITEEKDQLVWNEESLWPVAYSTLFQQLGAVLDLHRLMMETRIAQTKKEGAFYDLISEYPRQLPTHAHYAMASLGAWLGGAMNVQYFSYFATQPQIRNAGINRVYAKSIGYSAEQAAELDASGIVLLPPTLMTPLLEAQGSGQVFGSIGIDEFNAVNLPGKPVLMREESLGLPGWIMDRNYRAPFFARTLEDHALYGPRDVLRDHYTEFYAGSKHAGLVRCKHYCAPVIEVASLDDIRAVIERIPLRSEEGLFFRGQTSLYTLKRGPGVRRLLFGSSCSTEPSLVTSAARQQAYDPDLMLFALKYFLEQRVLLPDPARSTKSYEDWRRESVSPMCPIDYALLALSQHYGVPTHGLDVTTSKDVATWFAVNKYSRDGTGLAGYRTLGARDWPTDESLWPVIFVCQCVTHSVKQSLHDCHELTDFGFRAERPMRQHARFFLGGHSEHQNRLAETVVCVLRLKPAEYRTAATFESLFPGPDQDPAYRTLLELAADEHFGAFFLPHINRFHPT